MVDGVVMRDMRFYSQALGREMPYRVYLPQDAAAGHARAPLPVVYLLHGKGQDFREWSNYSEVSAYAARGMILVMPEGGSSYYQNAVERPQDRYEDYLARDLTADVEGRFPARRDRAGRAVAGVSMGGFGALKLALSHPEEYAFAGALSPPVDVPERGFTLRRAGEWWDHREIFGPMGSEARRERDLFALVQSAKPDEVPTICLTAGEQEALLGPDRRFAEELKRSGLAYEFYIRTGGHGWGQWNAQIPGCFEPLTVMLQGAR